MALGGLRGMKPNKSGWPACRMPTIPQALERLSVAHDVAKLGAALAVALPDSRRKRWLEAGLPIVEATRNLLHNHWVRGSWQRWDVHRSRSLYTMVIQHAEMLAHVGTENGTIRVYAVGPWTVAVEPHAWNELRTDASHFELAAALLAIASGDHPLMRIEQEANHEWSLEREPMPSMIMMSSQVSVLPEALRRRGRIDHIVEVDRLDPALAQHIVPGLGKDAERAAAAGLTVADLEDLLVRCLAAPERRAELVDQLISDHSEKATK